MQALLALDIDATIPTLVIGDFNTHSRTWSPAGIPRSLWAERVEEWVTVNLLTLANNPGEITRKGAAHERDSVIDLAWYNEAAVQSATFTELNIDWEGSLGSDHAMLHIMGHTREASPNQNADADRGFIVDTEKGEEWIHAFKARSTAFLFQLTPTAAEVEKAAENFMSDVCQTNEEILRKRRPLHPKAASWWNAACAVATQNLRNAQSTRAKGTAQARLKGTVRAAKRKWADEYIKKAQLWPLGGRGMETWSTIIQSTVATRLRRVSPHT